MIVVGVTIDLVLEIKNEGMPTSSAWMADRGSLFVRFEVIFPDQDLIDENRESMFSFQFKFM